MCRHPCGERSLGQDRGSELRERQDSSQRTRPGTPAGAGDTTPAARDRPHEISQRLIQNASEVAPKDCGWERKHLLLFYLRAKGTSPWSGRSSGRVDTMPTWRKPHIRPPPQKQTAPPHTTPTSAQTQYS